MQSVPVSPPYAMCSRVYVFKSLRCRTKRELGKRTGANNKATRGYAVTWGPLGGHGGLKSGAKPVRQNSVTERAARHVEWRRVVAYDC